MTAEIIWACPNFDKCKHWSADAGLCPVDGAVLVAHDERCEGGCPRCNGSGMCGDAFLGECLTCTGECVPHSERCGMVCDFECPRYQVREMANYFVPEIEAKAFIVHEHENIIDMPKCKADECEPCTWPDCLS